MSTSLAIVPDEPEVLAKGALPPEITYQNSNVAQLHAPRGDIENFSVARAALAKAKVQQGHRSAWHEIAPFEKAYLDFIAQVEFKAMGDQVSGIDGGFLAPEVWSNQFFGLLRNFSALDQLPITRYTVPARVTHLPRVSGDITVVYPGENAQITASQFKLGQVSYTGRKSAALITVSNELIRDGGDLADQVLRQQGAEAIAIDRDKQLLTGTGSVGPTGLLNLPQIIPQYCLSTTALTPTPTAAQPSYKNVGQMIQIVENVANANVTAGQVKCSGMIAHSQFKQTVFSGANFADSQGRPMWFKDLNDGGGMLGQNWSVTNLIPNTQLVAGNPNTSSIIAGAWEKYVLMECKTITFDSTTDGNAFQSDQTQVRLTYRYDGGPANVEAFGILAGVLL
jgi:HK97 family phage major capsid protein